MSHISFLLTVCRVPLPTLNYRCTYQPGLSPPAQRLRQLLNSRPRDEYTSVTWNIKWTNTLSSHSRRPGFHLHSLGRNSLNRSCHSAQSAFDCTYWNTLCRPGWFWLTPDKQYVHPTLHLSNTLQIYYHFPTRIPSAPVSKPSKSPALVPIFLPKTSIRRIALLLLLPLGANLFLQRWKLSVPAKLLTHSQWRCQFSRPRHCGLDNLIGEARQCVPGRGIQMLSQRWLLSWCTDSKLGSPSPGPPPPPASSCRWGAVHRPMRGAFVGALGVSKRLFWRGAGEEGEPAPPLPGSRLGGRHKN